MQVTLPLPPSDRELTRPMTIKKGPKRGQIIVYPTKAYKEWMAEAERWVEDQHTEVLEGDVTVFMVAYFPTRAGDVTNRVKAAHDFLEGRCIINDRQVVAAAQRREIDPGNPRVVLTIQPVTRDMFAAEERRRGGDRREDFSWDMSF